MNGLQEMADKLNMLASLVETFKNNYDSKFENLRSTVNGLELILARGGHGGLGSASGSFIKAELREYKNQFLAWARGGGNENALRDLEVRAGLSTDSDPDGGFLVPDEMEKEIERLAIDSIAMRRLARIVTVTGEYKKPLSKGGASGGWVGERETREETDTPELTMFEPKMSEVYALPEVTQKLLDMSDFDVAGWLVDEINDVFTEMEGGAFITGTGVKKPKGIIDDTLMVEDASWTYGKTGYITSGNASILSDTDTLISLQHALKPVYRKNAVWLMNDGTFEIIRKLKDGEGNYLWRPGLAENAPDTLLGKPVEIDDNMPDITANAYPIAFADWKRAYTIVDHRSGIRLLRDPYTKKGFVKFYTTKRVAGGISNYHAIKFLKIAE